MLCIAAGVIMNVDFAISFRLVYLEANNNLQ
jgi:hypothetical protein